MSKKRKDKSNVKVSFTNTKGQKVTVYKDGTKTRSGGMPEELAGLVNKADSLGIDTTQSRAMLAQDQAEGYKPYKGSSFETAQKGGKRYEPTILSTVGGKAKFQKNIDPIINRANQGMANLGIQTEETKEKTDISDKMLQSEYDASLSPEEKTSNDFIASLEKDSETITALYDKIEKASAQTARAETRALKEQYKARKRALEESNRTEYKQTQQAFIRSGQAEYSPTMTAGFLSAREREGQARIQDLDDQYMAKVDALNLALEEKNSANAAEEARALKEIEKEIRTEIQNQAKIAKEETQAIQERANVVKVAEYIKKNGVTNPVDIFAQFGGDVPFDIIKEITDAMPETKPVTLGGADILVDPVTGKVIARGSKVGGGGGTGGGGVGGASIAGLTPTDAAFAQMDYISKVASITRAVFGGNASDTDRERVEQLVSAADKLGMDRQAIIDRLSGYVVTNNPDLGSALKNVMLSIAGEKGLAEFNATGVADLINKGNYSQAIQKVENAVYEKARTEQENDFISETNVRTANQQVANLKADLESMRSEPAGIFDGDDLEELPIGVTKGTMEEWLGRFRGEDASKIKTRITEMVAKMRNDLLGSAVTDSESAFLEPIIPQISDRPNVFLDKLNRLGSTPLTRLNTLRGVYNLPALDTSSLQSTQNRVKLYEGIGATQNTQLYQTKTNADLDATIDAKLGGNTKPKVDANGYPI